MSWLSALGLGDVDEAWGLVAACWGGGCLVMELTRTLFICLAASMSCASCASSIVDGGGDSRLGDEGGLDIVEGNADHRAQRTSGQIFLAV